MTSCILTIIKNEHLYLDEWIKYHLDIGVNHIFIFEDIDSNSHKEITDKYKDKVTLNNIQTILNSFELSTVIRWKTTKQWCPQRIYFYKGLLYIKNNFNYDWCFCIDVDEFITLENENNNLQEIISLYNNYDALVLTWKCYGANNLINKPDYSIKGVVDTYLTPVQGYIPICNQKYNKKTCYNLKTYNNFYNDTHTPKDTCNFCNPIFEKNLLKNTYSKIYLRHYITKSWEEYVWKKTIRGYFMGFARSFEAFFKMNPEMRPLKNQLLSTIDEETLVVLPYSQRGSQGNEIVIALNCWKKFCMSKYHFVVVGSFSQQLKEQFDSWVEFIDIPDLQHKPGQYFPHLDIQHKMEVVYNQFRNKYSGFIWMVDDNYAIKPFYIFELKQIYSHQDNFTGVEEKPTWHWKHDKWKTRQLLDKEKLPCVNYTTHFPCYFEFDRIKQIWDKYNMKEESYVIEDIYFNSFLHIRSTQDNNIRLGIWNQEIFKNDFQKALSNPNIKFVCNSVEGWSPELEQALTKLYQDN